MKDIVHEAWHTVDRVGAERILSDQSPGSFLFRKDEFATILESQLTEQLHTKVTSFTLSFLKDGNHVVDRTIVCKDRHFYIYDDDPNLSGFSYQNIKDLLAHSTVPLTHPVLKEAA